MPENNQIKSNQTKRKAKVAKASPGGPRVGAGRKAGSLTKRTREIAEQAASKGITPLEVMLKTMHELLEESTKCQSHTHDENDQVRSHHDAGEVESRIKLLNMAATIAKHAAPYIHPRLSAIEHTGRDGAPLQSGVLVVPSAMSIDEWEQAAKPKP
ncbi:MAG: hypothetical protein Q8R65_07240 [Polynucleobacter sp.]|nr:hypothetical protein [Polynucleobacter sp.]MDZ4057658.1 hypothetical protein [Polynucleobacter sp.]